MSEHNFTFICGDDEYLLNQEGLRIFNEKSKDIPDALNQEIILGRSNNAGEVNKCVKEFCNSIQTIPLFGGKKVIWFKNINFLDDSVTSKAADTLSAIQTLQHYLSNINKEFVEILITACSVDKRRKEFKWFQSHGDYICLQSTKEAEGFRDFIIEQINLKKLKFTPNALDLFINNINENAQLGVIELEKIALYYQDEEAIVEEEFIHYFVPRAGEADFFALTDLFYSNNLNVLLEIIRHYFFHNKEARPILAALQNKNRLLIQLKSLSLEKNIYSITQKLLGEWEQKYKQYYPNGGSEKNSFYLFNQNPWYLSKLHQLIKGISLERLIEYQLEIKNIFQEVIEKYNNQQDVIESLAIKFHYK